MNELPTIALLENTHHFPGPYMFKVIGKVEDGFVARVVAAWKPGIAKIQYRLRVIDGSGRVVELFPPRDTRFDSGDVVPLLLRSGRYHTAVTSGNAFSREVLQRILPSFFAHRHLPACLVLELDQVDVQVGSSDDEAGEQVSA